VTTLHTVLSGERLSQGEAVKTVEHAVDVWDLRGLDPRLHPGMLLEHLNAFADECWEFVWMDLNVDLADHDGPCHVLVFKRMLEKS
jgi:hypothetical protein